MSLSSARNYALRASKSQDQKEAIELLSKAILELALSIEATDAKVKKINKSSELVQNLTGCRQIRVASKRKSRGGRPRDSNVLQGAVRRSRIQRCSRWWVTLR